MSWSDGWSLRHRGTEHLLWNRQTHIFIPLFLSKPFSSRSLFQSTQISDLRIYNLYWGMGKRWTKTMMVFFLNRLGSSHFFERHSWELWKHPRLLGFPRASYPSLSQSRLRHWLQGSGVIMKSMWGNTKALSCLLSRRIAHSKHFSFHSYVPREIWPQPALSALTTHSVQPQLQKPLLLALEVTLLRFETMFFKVMVNVTQFVAGCFVTWEKQTELRRFKCWLDCNSHTTLRLPPECDLKFLTISYFTVCLVILYV